MFWNYISVGWTVFNNAVRIMKYKDVQHLSLLSDTDQNSDKYQ